MTQSYGNYPIEIYFQGLAGVLPAERVVVAVLGVVLLVYATQLCWLVRGNVIPSLGVSRAAAYFPLPVSGLLMTLFALPQIVNGGHPVEPDVQGEIS